MVVTGTDTGVGKTIVTAAIAAALGRGVAVVKPAQTGDDSDVDTVTHLAAPAFAKTLASFPDPLAPLAAARVADLEPLDLYAVTDAIKEISAEHELTLVEGAGGLLVPMGLRPGGAAWTIADLAVALGAPAVVVVRAGLGTLNHTALTLEALERRGVPAHVVIGAWPASPELVHFTNLDDLPGSLHGLLPDAAGSLAPGVFRRSAPGWFTPELHGTCDNLRDLTDAFTD
ncbi:dethiobiotin synthase [Allorhizocola rhizosphaerae]|uniref:dethiobiotin synthase n=1 Tax=Allorhizocola rhizosphaerae TaxID=1872709 RepID=UPI000E3EB7B6|nr:dethiobiotin synthase [Allorhizocola rhizosphaerae]